MRPASTRSSSPARSPLPAATHLASLRHPTTATLVIGGIVVAVALVVGLVAAKLALGTSGAPAAPQVQQSELAELRFSNLPAGDRDALTAIEIGAGTVSARLTEGRPDNGAALAAIAGIEDDATALHRSIPRELRRYIGARARDAASALQRGDLAGAAVTLRDLQNTLARLRSS